jgi:hypothetical protein
MNTQSPPIIQTQNSITVVFDKPYTINRDHVSFLKVRKAIADAQWELVETLIDVRSQIEDYVEGNCEIRGGNIFYNDEEVHNVVADRIMQFMQNDIPWKPLMVFLNNLMENPSFNSRQELYGFLENENLPITEDGHFLAYKAVRSDYKDMWTGHVDNSIGSVVTMPRSSVDDNAGNGCSSGLHAGSLDYVDGYGGSRDHRKVIVKINPRDVVSVPNDDCRKLRCCGYKVVSEFGAVLSDSCYDSEGGSMGFTPDQQDYASCDSSFDDSYDWNH